MRFEHLPGLRFEHALPEAPPPLRLDAAVFVGVSPRGPARVPVVDAQWPAGAGMAAGGCTPAPPGLSVRSTTWRRKPGVFRLATLCADASSRNCAACRPELPIDERLATV